MHVLNATCATVDVIVRNINKINKEIGIRKEISFNIHKLDCVCQFSSIKLIHKFTYAFT